MQRLPRRPAPPCSCRASTRLPTWTASRRAPASTRLSRAGASCSIAPRADTRGNARETARWAASRGVARLALVTAAYHMPRAEAEFRRAMPGVEIVPHPVFPPHVMLDSWWRYGGTTRLLFAEYLKFRLAQLRP